MGRIVSIDKLGTPRSQTFRANAATTKVMWKEWDKLVVDYEKGEVLVLIWFNHLEIVRALVNDKLVNIFEPKVTVG